MVTQADSDPGELELVRAFVNTLDVEDGVDELSEPAALTNWLAAHGMHVERASQAELRLALAVREALRALLLANNGTELDPVAASVLDSAAQRARLSLRFRPDGGARYEAAAGGVDGCLGRLLGIAADAMAAGTWSRLKACRSRTCRWAFYDRARNRSRRWCDMAVCGNRVKARAYRRRRATGES
jgi:predicted RNA-binding Zn ribbon-like protein